MKIQRLLIGLTVVNLGLLIYLLLSHIGPAPAANVLPMACLPIIVSCIKIKDYSMKGDFR